eukprot:SAG11_NODE_34251_length_273_cov_0.586207_1_plen_46_part_01
MCRGQHKPRNQVGNLASALDCSFSEMPVESAQAQLNYWERDKTAWW